MKKKYIAVAIITAIVILLVVTGVLIANYYLSFKKVTIEVERAGLTAEVYKDDFAAEEGAPSTNPKVGSVKSAETVLTLQPGTYYVTPTSKDVDTTPIAFTVDKADITVKVNPGFSQDYLNGQVPKEEAIIDPILKAKYPLLTSAYTLNSGKLYNNGEWYATTMAQNVNPQDVGDTYRTVLHKVNNKWTIAAAPQLVLTSSENKGIPTDILKDVNKLEEGAN